MSVFKFPASVCNKITSLLSDFWWGNTSSKGIHWKKWEALGLDKSVGGLGFRDLKEFNNALLAKQCWRLISNPNALWVRVLKAIYFQDCGFLKARKGASPSWIWSSLLEGRNLLGLGVCWQIGNGDSVDFWNDNWIPNFPSMSLRQVEGGRRPFLPVSSIINRRNENWNFESVSNVIPEQAVRAIAALQFGPESEPDKLIWAASSSGNFSVKSGYRLACKDKVSLLITSPHQSHQVNSSVWSWVWKINSLPKIKLFLWKVVSNIVATNATRFRRHMAASAVCPICDKWDETIEHCLLLCPLVQAVWRAHPFSYSISEADISTFDAWLEGLIVVHVKRKVKECHFSTTLSFLLWNIWKARCKLVFNKDPFNPIEIATSASRAAQEFLLLPSCNSPARSLTATSVSGMDTIWKPPDLGSVKINVDAAWTTKDEVCGLAAIARNNIGLVVGGLASTSSAISALAAEAQAIDLGFNLASSLSLSCFQLESDSLVLISAFLNPLSVVDWSASQLITKIRRRSGSFLKVNWRWASRSANEAADLVAKLVQRRVCPVEWFSNPPPSLMRILLFDAAVQPP